MKKLTKKFKKILFRFFCLVVSIFLIFAIPANSVMINDNLDRIYGTFVGEKSAYKGIIEVWNIDTFENGSASKTSILNAVAKDFQQKYKSAYVLVRNISEKECENMLLQGQKPDLFSCSYGVSANIKQYLQKFDQDDFNLYPNLLNAGKDENGDLFGVAWCAGLYFLISSKDSLQKAGMNVNEDFSLLNNAFNLGYVSGGKKPKNVYSLSFSTKGYLMPKQALISYNEAGEDLISELSFDKSKTLTQYEAYIDFLLGKSVALLGTQRDVVRIIKRLENGKIQDVLIEPVLSSSDLVQFMFMTKNEDKTKLDYVQNFVGLLVSEKQQSRLASANMFSTFNGLKLDYKIDAMQGITTENLGGLKLNNVFLPLSEIKKLQ